MFKYQHIPKTDYWVCGKNIFWTEQKLILHFKFSKFILNNYFVHKFSQRPISWKEHMPGLPIGANTLDYQRLGLGKIFIKIQTTYQI